MKKILIILLLLPCIVKAQTTPVSIGYSDSAHYLRISNNSTTFPAPQSGTLLHLISSGITVNPRISMDAYNSANVFGSIFQGRRAGGSAGSPTAALADYTLAGFAGDGYGVDSFHNISVGAYVIKSEGTMTNTSAPTYLSLMTTLSGSTTIAERMRIKSTGGLRFNSYGSGTFTGTPTYTLQVDASGNVIEGGLGGSATWGNITGTLSTQSDLQSALDLKAPIASPTFTGTVSGVTAAMVGLGNVTNESKATMFTSPAFTGTATGIGIPVYAQVTGSNATTTGQALTDVTGLSVALTTNAVYEFEAVMSCQTSAVTTGTAYGVQYSVAGAAVEASISGASTTTAMKSLRINALNSATALYLAGSAQTGGILIKGRITTGANAGNLTIQHLKLTSGTSTVFIGSFLKVTRIS